MTAQFSKPRKETTHKKVTQAKTKNHKEWKNMALVGTIFPVFGRLFGTISPWMLYAKLQNFTESGLQMVIGIYVLNLLIY